MYWSFLSSFVITLTTPNRNHLCFCPAGIAARYSVSKYPTLKLFRYGLMTKREYRGQRSVDAITAFVHEQLRNPIAPLASREEIELLDVSTQICSLSIFFRFNYSSYNSLFFSYEISDMKFSDFFPYKVFPLKPCKLFINHSHCLCYANFACL